MADEPTRPTMLSMKQEMKALNAFVKAMEQMEPIARTAMLSWLIARFK